MYRASVAKKVGKYNPKMFLAEDYDYWMRIASIGNISYEDENLYIYRSHKKSLTATRIEDVRKIANKVRYKNLHRFTARITKNPFEYFSIVSKMESSRLKKAIFYREKIGNKRIVHILGIKFSYKKQSKIGV